jgi:glucokinase
MNNKTIAIGVDLGGTRIKAVAMNESGECLHQLYLATNDGLDAPWKLTVKQAAEELIQTLSPDSAVVGISAPGLPNDENTAIAYMPGRMQGLENFEWSSFLSMPAFVANDAVAALMAEARIGAAVNKRHVVMLTLGTGVGGAILIDGKPYQGAFGKAGHIGHMVIDSEGEPDIIGIPGSLEDCIGNCTIEKRSHGRFASSHALLQAHRAADEQATEIWLKSVRHLAMALASITNILSPETIVLGGGITEAGDDLFEPLNQFMAQYEWRAGGRVCEIVKAHHGDMAGAIGAACFAFQKFYI